MCKACGSKQQSKFRSEVCVHFKGQKDLNRSPVVAFPELTICLNCGIVSDFLLEESELDRLREVHVAA